ncbi:hypothetical protein WICMUC_001289 [Wickerhamomyces mucosus]|uniref:Uncharacterized protein n=1 Tax=Wickerhamomyces mucosus TaxID=1378264 RepID=A0A9P8PVB3_9ASCO|nr:hypothetical protein WICMUC_001289 [Wickerhamomyces mucosus]
MKIQPINKLAEVKDWNQPKTLAAAVETFIYANGMKTATNIIPQYGKPLLLVFKKMAGACFLTAKANRVLEPPTKAVLETEKAEVKTAALMISGKTLIPAVWIATTNGDVDALPEPLAMVLFLEETIKVKEKTVIIIKIVTL